MATPRSLPSQTHVIGNLNKFLRHLGQREIFSELSERERGLSGRCNGLGHMLKFAEILNQRKQFFDRLNGIAQLTDEQIEKLARLYKKYQIENADDMPINASDRVLLEKAKDMYIFSHAVLFGQNPKILEQILEEKEHKSVQQDDFIAIANIIAPASINVNQLQSRCNLTISLDEEKLADVLDKMIKENEFYDIAGEGHVILVNKKNGKFYLYDSNKGADQVFTDLHSLAEEIRKDLFKNSNKQDLLILKITGSKYQASPDLKDEKSTSLPKSKDFVDLKNINAKNKSGETLLHRAAAYGDSDLVEFLLSQGADPNIKSTSGLSPLHLACSEGHEEIARCLIKYNADPTAKNNSNFTPLTMAMSTGKLALVKMLHEEAKVFLSGDDRDILIPPPMFFAVGGGNPQIVQYLIEKNISLENKYNILAPKASEYFFTAIKNKSLETAKLLLSKINPDDLRVFDSFDEESRSLYGRRIPMTTIFCLIVEMGDWELYSKFRENFYAQEHEYIKDARFGNSLHIAAVLGHTRIVLDLLEHSKIPIDAVNRHGQSALTLAIDARRSEVVDLLMNKGAVLDITKINLDSDGAFILSHAIATKRIDLIIEIMKKTATDKPKQLPFSDKLLAMSLYAIQEYAQLKLNSSEHKESSGISYKDKFLEIDDNTIKFFGLKKDVIFSGLKQLELPLQNKLIENCLNRSTMMGKIMRTKKHILDINMNSKGGIIWQLKQYQDGLFSDEYKSKMEMKNKA